MILQKGSRFGCAFTAFWLVLALSGCGGSETESSADSSTEGTGPTTVVAGLVPDEEGASAAGELANCEPTQADMLGPFYEPNAPIRNSVDSGYVLSGSVLAADSCAPIQDARIEFWLANEQGVYDDAHRATVPVGTGGEYRFESNVPVPYENRPPHVHIRVTAPGYQELITQHYPEAGQTEASFDLVLAPA